MRSEPCPISVVLPAYNEAARLPPYLASIREYLEGPFAGWYEVIVVDDGSRDGSPDLLARLFADWPQLVVLRHRDNLGKGAAVRTGMLAARGSVLLFADADGAAPIVEERRLRQALDDGADLAIGSRLVGQEPSLSARRWHRGHAGRSFAWLARRLLGLSVQDPQCGFKMFRRTIGRTLFGLCREPGYLFDLEVLGWALRLEHRVAEVPICWQDVPGSNVRLARDGARMVRGLWSLRRRLRADSMPAGLQEQDDLREWQTPDSAALGPPAGDIGRPTTARW